MNYNTLIADALAYLRGAPVTLAGDKLIQTRQAADMIERALTNDQQTAVPVGWVRVRGTPDDPDPEFHFSDTPPAYAYNAHTSFDGWFPVYRQSPKSFIWKAEAERLINGIVEARRQIRNAMDRSPDSASKVAFTRALDTLPTELPQYEKPPHVHFAIDVDQPSALDRIADALERIASRPIAKSIIDHPGWPTPLPGEQGWRPSKEWREGFLAGHFKASQETCPHSRGSVERREWIKGHTAAV